MIQHITLWEPRYNGGFTNAELTGNTYLSGTLVRKPQNMLASLWSDWFSPLYLPGRLRFGGALNQLRLEGHQVWEADVARLFSAYPRPHQRAGPVFIRDAGNGSAGRTAAIAQFGC